MIKKILAAWLIGLLCLSAALAEEAPGNPMLSPGEDNDDDRVISLDPDDYERPVTPFQLGLQESGVVPDGYFDDAVFVGDSITLKLYHYVKDMRNQGTPCLGGAKFLTAGSLGSGNALWPVSKESVHPSYQGEKMRIEKAIELMGARKVYIMLGMNDVAYYGLEQSVTNMNELVGLILERSPGADIFVQSVTPRLASITTNPTNRALFEYNLAMYKSCVENGWYFVDVASVMRDENGNLIEAYCSDPESMGMHFTDAGCAVWIEYLETHGKEE